MRSNMARPASDCGHIQPQTRRIQPAKPALLWSVSLAARPVRFPQVLKNSQALASGLQVGIVGAGSREQGGWRDEEGGKGGGAGCGGPRG